MRIKNTSDQESIDSRTNFQSDETCTHIYMYMYIGSEYLRLKNTLELKMCDVYMYISHVHTEKYVYTYTYS